MYGNGFVVVLVNWVNVVVCDVENIFDSNSGYLIYVVSDIVLLGFGC